MSAPNPNPFAVPGTTTITNAAEHGAAPLPGTVGLPGGMAQLDELTVDYDEVVSNRMPVGIFALVLSDIQPGTAQSGNAKHVFHFTCIDINHPKEIGKQSQIHASLSGNALWKHQETAGALGLANQGKVTISRKDAIGRCVLGEFAQEPDQNQRLRVNLIRVQPHPMGLGIRYEQLQQMQGRGLPQVGAQPGAQPTSVVAPPAAGPQPAAQYNYQSPQVQQTPAPATPTVR